MNNPLPVNEAPIIAATQLSKTYGSGPIRVDVLRNVEFMVPEHARIGIVGASGSGKSTLLHLLGGLDQPTSGSVSICGEMLSQVSDARRAHLRNQNLGFVYQFHHLLAEFSALENVAMPLLIARQKTSVARKQALEMLALVGLENRAQHKPGELSGGERQRVAIARALVTRPRAVLADEPTGNLDRKNAQQIVELLLDLNKSLGTSLVVVTHDHELAQNMDTVYTMQDGSLDSAIS